MGEIHVIPFRQKAIEAKARKHWRGDTEETTPVQRLVVHGVTLTSRYDKAHEYDEMAAIIEALPPELCCLIESVFCDSKAPASFDVQLRESVPPRIARRIGEVFEQACFVTIGGHNGIGVNPGHVLIDPDWQEPIGPTKP